MRLLRALTLRRLSPTQLSRHYSSGRTVKENDVLFLRQQGTNYPRWHLTAPLRRDARVRLAYGASVNASDLIGRSLLDVVTDSKGRNIVLHEPSMATYIINSARQATPIYPHDASTIVSLLDLNLPRPGEEDEELNAQPFEIFEAGTGMGSLTLHLARALHAANPATTPALRTSLCTAHYKPYDFGLDLSPEDQASFDSYRASRRAVLHTLDRNAKHSRAAHKLIRQYRRALYFPTVDFHVGSIDDYLSERLAQTGGAPFLSHAILDLPSAEENAVSVIQALKPNGLLILFQPSISQIGDFQAWMRSTDQPVRFERVLEFPISTTADGVRDTGGGREWDVKTVVPRGAEADAQPVQIMRPKVGDRVAGGGFVAVLRRHHAIASAEVEPVEPVEPVEESRS
ncbi:S-adenosyl-L-methionine-dependent methyltransferase [Dactylonectria macrodidyma]|uniref:tRNA (adenine(58)-N(1))-methyltransferase catalytic subunit TRM61 n=1 Tax=Dactylonectria macrodidyma TaxID=307937 RepID=A0A9P9F4R2_9HYPO|nr:S-adenosyl-L-methionine-dependent methyltransferase [Dactylonectria macrodidyma]